MAARFSWLQVRDRSAYIRLIGVVFLVFMAAGLTAPLMANYIKSLGADTGQIGLLFAITQMAALLSQYWWGRHSDLIGRRKPLLLFGTAGLAIVFLLAGSVNWYGWLFVVRLFEGLAMAAYGAGSLAIIGDLLENEGMRGRLMGTYRMFGSLAFAPAALGGGWLADSFGLRVPIFMAAGCFALACLIANQIQERPPTEHAPVPATAAPADDSALPANPHARQALWPFLGLTFAWFFGMGAVVSLWPVYMSGVGYQQTYISGLWALAAAGEVPCLVLAGYLADRWGRKWVMLIGVLGMSFIYTAYTISTALIWLIPIQMFRSFTYSCFETPALLYATELGLRKQRGRLAGLYQSASGFGGISGSVIGGTTAQQFGMVSMYRGVVMVMVAVALIVAKTMPRLRAPGTAPEPAKHT